MSYTINFTDPATYSYGGSRGSFIIPVNTTNGPNSPLTDVRAPTSQSADSSILIYGKDVPDYGERIGENFLQMLENFSSPVPPQYPLRGQLWNKTGNGYRIIGANLPLNTVTIQGNHVAEIQQIIDEPFVVGGEVNPAGSIRIIDADKQTVIETEPENVYLNGAGNTEIQFITGTFTGIDNVLLTANYVTTVGNRFQLMWYDDGYLSGTAGWKAVNAGIVSDDEPSFPQEGQIWVDTSQSPPVVRPYINGQFTEGLLSLEGGSLTGKVYYPSTETVSEPLELVPKSYVDDEISQVSGGQNQLIQDLRDDVDDHEVRITTLESDFVVLSDTVDDNYADLDQRINTNASDIATNATNIAQKLDLSGGTLLGNVNFEFNNNINSAGINWVGSASSNFTNYALVYRTLANATNDYVTHKVELTSPGTTSNAVYDIRYRSADDITDTVILSGRKNSVLVQNPIYEVDPSSVTVGSLPSSTFKYQTELDVSNYIASLGNLLVGGNQNWDAQTYTLTLGGIDSDIVIDLSHTHSSEDFNVVYTHSVTSTNQNLPYEDAAEVLLSPVVKQLDIIAAPKDHPTFIGPAKSVSKIQIQSVDQVNGTVDVSEAELIVSGITSGDPLLIYGPILTAQFIIRYSQSTSGNINGSSATGLANDTTEYSFSVRFDNEPLKEFTITEQGQNLQTYNDIISWMNTAFGTAGTASIVNGDFVVSSNLTDFESDVNVILDTTLTSTAPFSDVTPPSISNIQGTDSFITHETAYVSHTSTGGVATVSLADPIVAGTEEEYGFIAGPSFATQYNDLITLKDFDRLFVSAGEFGLGVQDATSPYASIGAIDLSSMYAFESTVSDLPANFNSAGEDVEAITLAGTANTESAQLVIQGNQINFRTKTGNVFSDWNRLVTATSVNHVTDQAGYGLFELPDSSPNDTLEGNPTILWANTSLSDTAGFAQEKGSLANIEEHLVSLWVSSDGWSLFAAEVDVDSSPNSSRIVKIDLESPWSPAYGQGVISQTAVLPLGFGTSLNLCFDRSGRHLYVLSRDINEIFHAVLDVAWDLTSISSSSVNSTILSFSPTGAFDIHPNGTTLWFLSTDDNAYEVTLGTPFDLNTAGAPTVVATHATISNFRTLQWSRNGKSIFVTSDDTVNSETRMTILNNLQDPFQMNSAIFQTVSADNRFPGVGNSLGWTAFMAPDRRTIVSSPGPNLGTFDKTVWFFDVAHKTTVDFSSVVDNIYDLIVTPTLGSGSTLSSIFSTAIVGNAIVEITHLGAGDCKTVIFGSNNP